LDLSEINIDLSSPDAVVASGLSPLDIKVCCNTSGDITREQVKANSKRDLRWIIPLEANVRKAVIVGGGPSLKSNWGEILFFMSQGADVFALNGACEFMNERGILPTYQVMVDPRPGNVELIGLARQYLLASQCHPSIFDAAPAHKTGLFHMAGSAMDLVNGTLIGGDVTVGLVATNLAFTLGYREMHLYGYDSSYADGEHHAYAQDQSSQESKTLEVFTADGRKFITNFAMAKQAELFPKNAELLCNEGAVISVHGTGLLPAIAHSMHKLPQAAE
jgi:hypothetical protein